MKRATKLLLLLATVLMCAQCGHNGYHPQLVLLDSLADLNADSAVNLMRQIEPLVAEADERDRRYFELLSIKVADKADLLMPTDTVAWQLVDWYEQHGDHRLLPMAYYYAARVCRTRNDSPQALDYLLKARDLLSDDDSQLHLKAVVNSQMGYIFSQQKLYRDAINSFRDALNNDITANDSIGLIFDLMEIGFNFENVNRRDSSIIYLRKAADLALLQKNEKMVFMLKVQIANLYYLLGDYHQARVIIREAINYNDIKNQSAIYSVGANIYKASNMTDSAMFCYHILTNLTSVYAKRAGYRGLSDYYSKHENLGNAHFYFSQYRLYSDSIDKITASNAIAQMHSLYNYQLRERENKELRNEMDRHKRILYAICSSALFIILLGIIVFLYIRHKDLTVKIKLERRKRIETAIELASINSDERNNKAERLLNSPIVNTLRKILNDPSNINKVVTNEEWEELEECVARLYPTFKDSIIEVCKLTSFKLHLCLLLKAHFSASEIALLTQHSNEAVSSARRRMAKTAFGEDRAPADWDNFVESL